MRCFIAIPLSQEIKEKIAEIQKHFEIPGIKLVEKENLHITLKFLGEVEEGKVRQIVEILREIEFEQFEFEILNVNAFPSTNFVRVIWLDVKGREIYELKRLIDSLLEEIGFSKDDGWVPHLTIARVKFLKDREALFKTMEKLRSIKVGNEKAERFVLFESRLRREGPIYNKIEEIKLC